MESNKFTKEQFLLLAECEYAFCDNVERIGDMLSGKAEDFKTEVLTLGKRAEEIMPDVVEVMREILKIDPRIGIDVQKKAMWFFVFEKEVRSSKKCGLLAIICLCDELKKKEAENESNS